MQHKIRIHYDNQNGFLEPIMWVWVSDGATLEREIRPTGRDDFGVCFDLAYNRSSFNFKFKDGQGEKARWEDDRCNRYFHGHLGKEVWAMADRHHVYNVLPAKARGDVKDYYRSIKNLVPQNNFYFPATDVSGLGMPSMLGANLLTDGSVLFGFFHPYAARVYLTGSFNDWQCPGHPAPQKEQFIEMELYRGFYYQPNIWLARITPPAGRDAVEYKFYLQGGSAETERYVTDPYTRLFSDDYKYRNSIVVDPTGFNWTDQGWQTPGVKDLILYELNIYGFTDNDPRIPEPLQGTFKGVTHRIKSGYFNTLGVTAIALMPTAEVPMKQGLGYEPCTFMSVEKDFGTPDDFREMVNEAHRHGLAVIMDQVFNHTSNDFNPLWNLIDDGSGEGGFYFAGKTMWGNKVATGKDEVDNMLIDACKMFIREYHVDGFRFDATHSYFLNHRLLHRLAHEIKDLGFKPDVVMIAENLPNEQDLNLEGYNGYAQWSNIFHDKVKALLREGTYEGVANDTEDLAAAFYFSKDSFAAHTNNVVNYCESHDENSVQFEVATGDEHLRHPAIKEKKARLGLMAAMVALGQPMIYMGQEFGIERERNRIKVPWAGYTEENNRYYQWSKGLINLRKRYEALKLSGYDPIKEGQFTWLIGPWLEENKGGRQRVIGWRVNKNSVPGEQMLIMLNFEGHDVPVDVDFTPGQWVKLADINHVNDLAPSGSKNPRDPDSITINHGPFKNFILPPYSGFIYRNLPAQL
ncbi:alpha-amylase family glycosyl hydrolase [Desulfoscipio sp. XC116]|uniref:alpha-amylase family glycosyl hydrolase n=1 Tax=Desulfoscipio sp. XC116 TaxID=3144975 RepID=UPI00325B077C